MPKSTDTNLAAAQSHPTIRKLAEENTRLAELRTGPKGLVATNATKVAELKDIDEQLAKLNKEFEGVKDKVKAAGLTDVIGVILLSKRGSLPDVRKHQLNIKSRRSETARARLEWLKYDEQDAEFSNSCHEVPPFLRVKSLELTYRKYGPGYKRNLTEMTVPALYR